MKLLAYICLLARLPAAFAETHSGSVSTAETVPHYGCPTVLMSRLINHDQKDVSPLGVLINGAFKNPIAQNCLNQIPRHIKEPASLERFFAEHPITRIPGLPKDFITQCVQNRAELRRAGIDRPLTALEQMHIISDWYFTMNRLRNGAKNALETLQATNALLGKKNNDGFNAPGSHIPGVREFTDPQDDCIPRGDGIKNTIARLKQTLSNLDAEARKKYPTCVDHCSSEITEQIKKDPVTTTQNKVKQITLREAQRAVIADGNLTPYGNEPQIREIIRRLLNGEDVPSAEIEGAYARTLFGIRPASIRKLNEIETISRCLEGADSSCFSEAWWQKWMKTFDKNHGPDAQTMLSGMPDFDFEGFLKVMYDRSKTDLRDRRQSLDVAALLSDAECLATQRLEFDKARNTEDEFYANAALAAGGAAVKVAGAGIEAGMARGSINAGRSALLRNNAIRGVMSQNAGLARNLGIFTRIGSRSDLLLKPALAGKAATFALKVGQGVDAAWFGFGGAMAYRECTPIIEKGRKEAELRKIPGCARNLVQEFATLEDWTKCAVTATMMTAPAMAPAILRASGYVVPKLPQPARDSISKASEKVAQFGKKITEKIDRPGTELALDRATQVETRFYMEKFNPEAPMTPEQIIQSNNPFQIMGVPPGTFDPTALRRALGRRGLEFHPDLHGSQRIYDEALIKINAAYEILTKRAPIK